MYPQAAPAWDDDGHSDPPSTRSSNDPPEHMAHLRSRSTAHAQSPKRLSVFSGRSRSNTTTSTSSRRSPGSSMTSIDSGVGQPDERTASSLGMRADKSDRPSRSFLARGSRILRRQGSKINIVATLDEEDEQDREKPRSEKLENGGMFGRRARHSENHERLKSIISDPFDFHHLTHTSPSQFQSLDQTRENDLVTEFSVIRASQRPEAVLKGIRADDIHFHNFSADDLPALGTAATVDEPVLAPSPPGSPAASGSVSPKGHVRRESRAHENFSRPASRYPRSCPTTPPPPAGSEMPLEAEPAPRAIDEILGLSSPKTYPEYIESPSATQLRFSPDPADNMTIRTGTSSMSSHSHYDLEDVPEEEEATRLWDSPGPSIGYAHSRSTSQVSPGTVEEPTGVAIPRGTPNGLSIFVAEELSRKFSEALGSPTLPQNLPNASSPSLKAEEMDATPPSAPGMHQFSYEDELYDSWDADIDYCYEHAAESTSNFDWSRTSLEEQRPQIGIACTDEGWGLEKTTPKSRHLQPSPLSTSTLPTPDLDPSASVRSTAPHSAATPSTGEYERDFMARTAGDYFQPVSSPMLPSTLGKQINQETLYEEYLSTDAESDRHFPFVAQGMENHPVSPRSSFSPISKCNSQESLMLSRAASIVRKHRSSISTTSVPELIHSLSNSRELMPTDRLTAAEALAAGSISRPPSSSHHRQTKSLAESHLMLQAGASSTSLPNVDVTSPSPIHDRAKSTSEVDPRHKTEPPLPPLPPMNPNRKKSRNPSYSLFPTAA
ncbi:hypothetical protein N7532_007406 [Penicillium argentinense]|uniref:CRIB domain-containing protein n=1 Tax=Penicillium argentinense TaxID=1131581 RepID=A0A9W9K703_9EURO|nr:uncharacterized protein N7532_007406 [Penicillium argentinense]KAJ5095115.1 hypothetical protein N7532_007406 [Penicillium argentinense]